MEPGFYVWAVFLECGGQAVSTGRAVKRSESGDDGGLTGASLGVQKSLGARGEAVPDQWASQDVT